MTCPVCIANSRSKFRISTGKGALNSEIAIMDCRAINTQLSSEIDDNNNKSD